MRKLNIHSKKLTSNNAEQRLLFASHQQEKGQGGKNIEFKQKKVARPQMIGG